MTTRITMTVSLVLLVVSGTACVQPVVESGTDSIPVLASGARILFQGDSITDGKRGRSQDPNHILGHGCIFAIASKYGAGFPELKQLRER